MQVLPSPLELRLLQGIYFYGVKYKSWCLLKNLKTCDCDSLSTALCFGINSLVICNEFMKWFSVAQEFTYPKIQFSSERSLSSEYDL